MNNNDGVIGRPLPFVDCKLVDLESNVDVDGAHKPGEIRVKVRITILFNVM